MQQGFPIILHSITQTCAGDLGLVHVSWKKCYNN